MKTILAPLGGDSENLYVAVKQFQVQKVILINADGQMQQATEITNFLKKLLIPCQAIHARGELWTEMFRIVKAQAQTEGKDLLINISTGNTDTATAIACASFVNAVQAFRVSKGEVMLLPLMRFNYYTLVGRQKMRMLKILNEKGPLSLDELASKSKMSPPLISYHLNGNKKSDGLREMGLVQTTPRGQKQTADLSVLGKSMVLGYL